MFSFSVEQVDEDAHGVWLSALRGSRWTAPHDTGNLPFDVLILIGEARNWVVWWVDDSYDKRVEVDICLPPSRTSEGWGFVDLELDPMRHESSGLIVVHDRDDFDEACRQGWITRADAEVADATARTMADALRVRRPPFGEEGWTRLSAPRGEGT